MSAPHFTFTTNASPVVELGLGDTRVPTGTGVWDSAIWDDTGAVWQGVEPSWWNVSCFAIEAEIATGRERATDRFVPSTAGIVLNNEDGWADMAGSPESIAAVSLRPGRAIRIGVDVASIGRVWRFRGIIDRVMPSYDPIHPDYVKLDCIDLLGEVGHVKLVGSSPVGGDDTVTDRIDRVLDAAKHPDEKRVIAADSTKLVQTSYDAQVIDLLGQAADSAGGIVYGDTDGNIVYKAFGWQQYVYGTPNDGAIGNIAPTDICPTGWDVSYDRVDLATQVELNRALPEPIPDMAFVWSSSLSTPPPVGAIQINSSDQTLPNQMYVRRTSANGVNVDPFIRNLKLGDVVTVSDRDDTQNQSRTYSVTGNATITVTAGNLFWVIPVSWIDGQTGVGGNVTLGLTVEQPAAYVLDDVIGQAIYGTETYSLTDLIAIDNTLFPALARRALATRGHIAMPRLEAVTLDAKAARGNLDTLELMALVRPELPSRYMCRLRTPDGRVVFNRNMFAVGARTFISSNEWTVRITLDDADWAASPNGKIVAVEDKDVATITGTVS